MRYLVQPPKLLIIEHEEATRDTLTSQLRRRGYATLSCHSIEEAERHMQKHQDIRGIITEWELSSYRGNTEEAGQPALWADARAIPVIYFSYADAHGIRDRLFDVLHEAYGEYIAPEFTYIAKPYLSFLVKAVEVMMPLPRSVH